MQFLEIQLLFQLLLLTSFTYQYSAINKLPNWKSDVLKSNVEEFLNLSTEFTVEHNHKTNIIANMHIVQLYNR